MCLLDNREVRQGWQALKDAVTGMFQKHGAEIVSARRWNERRLAYPIKHQQRGTYLLVYFEGEPDVITPLRRELELSEVVLRNLVLTCDKVPEEASEPEEAFDESQVQVEDVYQAPPPPAAPPADETAEEGKGKAEAAKEGEASADAKADAKSDDKADAKSDDKADAKADAKADDKADTKADAKADDKADDKADTKADAKADDKADTKADDKADTKA